MEEAYQRAKNIGAAYLICASNWLPVFCLAAAFERNVTIGAVQGSYISGTYKGLPVIISPTMDSFEMWGLISLSIVIPLAVVVSVPRLG